MRDGVPRMVVRYARWHDRLRALWPGRKRQQRALVQAVVDAQQPEVELKMRDLYLYGATCIDGHTGKRIPPEDVRVFPRA